MDTRTDSSREPDRPVQVRAGYAGAAGRSRRHGSQHRADRRHLPRARRRVAAAFEGAQDAGDRADADRRRRDRRHLREARRGRGDGRRRHSRHPDRQPDRRADQDRPAGPACRARRSDRLRRQHREPDRARRGFAQRGQAAARGDRGQHRHESRGRRAGRAGGGARATRSPTRPGLRFVGVVGWESQATTIADPAEKERTVRDAVAALTASAARARRRPRRRRS